jgi:membrane fusion protein, multidrug efflux system
MKAPRRALLGLVALVVLVGLVALVATRLSATGATPTPSAGTPSPATAQVERRTLSSLTRLDATIGFGTATDLLAGVSGTLTHSRAPGVIVERGASLYEVDGKPTAFLLYGARPAWRALGPGATPGADIRQLKQNMQALGYERRHGAVTARWDAATTRAVKAWQRHLHVPADGLLPMGTLVFRSGPVRIDSRKAAVGVVLGPGTAVYGVTSRTVPIVSAQLRADNRSMAAVGATVRLQLVDGTTATGHIGSIAPVVSPPDSAAGAQGAASPAMLALVIIPDAALPAGTATVTVVLTGETHPNVLAVPLTALVALHGGGYGVESVEADGSRAYRPVQIGMAASGYVEIAGPALAEGLRVVVAE